MAFITVAGGYKLTPEDRGLVNSQRAITKSINDGFIQVGAVYLKPSNKNPYDEDWFNHLKGDTNLQSWIDDPTHQPMNVGFNLQLGWTDIDMDAEDPEYNKAIVAGLGYNGVDTRFQFGRQSVGCATHVMVQLGEDESANFNFLAKFEPKAFKIGDRRFHTQIRSFATNTDAKNLAYTAKQTVMPGSVYSHKTAEGKYDISVWYANSGVANKVTQIAATTARKASFNEIVRGIAFGTVLYVIRDRWVPGERQSTATKLCGWLARVVADSAAMNNHEAMASEVYCPVDADSTAESLIKFLCAELGDDEVNMRVRTYYDARGKLSRNPDAKIPGWPTMEQLIGAERVMALRAVFMPGSDVSELTKMAERYVYDESDNLYIDRNRFWTTGGFVHEGAQLERRHKGDVVRIGGKPREAFRVFESSDLRKRVGLRELYPDLAPGGIFRISGIGEVVPDDSDDDITTLSVFNTWRGWPVSAAVSVNAALMEQCETYLHRLLGLLTRDNENQIKWIQDWLAWTFQHPGDKQQIALVMVGGQGVGKSWFGNRFLPQLMGSLWGSASPKVLEGDFSIAPFLNKMMVFIDEAKFHSEAAVDEIKKLIRGIDVPGAEKFVDARNYRLFSRMLFASNRMDVNIGQANTTDRALFYARTYDKDHLGMKELEFRTWAETLKPWFTEFDDFMKRTDVRQHYVRYFMDRECNKYEIESIKYSSSTESHIVLSNMNWARRVAKHIIEDGRIHEDLDISYPFTPPELFRRVGEVCRELGMPNVQGARILAEFDEAGLIEKVVCGGQRKMRFVCKIGELNKRYGETIGAPLEERFVFDAERDFGPNDCDGSKRPPWLGAKVGVVAGRF